MIWDVKKKGDWIAAREGSRSSKGGRVPTGIEGFDSLIEGGLPRGSNVLVTGMPGTGKTIFGLNYLYRGAQMGERGLYVSIDSFSEQLKQQGARFNWDLDGMEKSGKLFFLKVPLGKVKVNLFDIIMEIKKEINAERIVLDNLTTFAINAGFFTIKLREGENIELSPVPMGTSKVSGEFSAVEQDREDKGVVYAAKSDKRMTYLIVEKLAEIGTTNLIITYGNRNASRMTVDGVSEFICDGIVELSNDVIGNKRIRTMSVVKMRATDHSQYIHEFSFGKDGIVVKPAETIYGR